MTDCVVVGAGPAGLATSAALTQRGVDHVILERGQAGDTWRTQRWDSFRLNTAAWMNQMLEPQQRYAYAYRAEVVQKLDELARNTPIHTGVRVARLAPAHDRYGLQTSDGEVRIPSMLDGDGQPRRDGIAAVAPGVWYVGLRWLTQRGSVIFFGFPTDAAAVADAVKVRLDGS